MPNQQLFLEPEWALRATGIIVLVKSSQLQNTLVSTSPVFTVRIEESGEKIVAKDSSADVEAIQDILMEIADMRYPVYASLCSIKKY